MDFGKSALLLIIMLANISQAQVEDTLPVGAVLERSIPATPSVEAFRQTGDNRVWRYYGMQTTLGQISSTVTGPTDFEGRPALAIREAMRLDYGPLRGDRVLITEGTTYLSPEGFYLGSDLEIGDTSSTERLKVACTGEGIAGEFTRGGTEQSIEMALPCDRFFWDIHMIDQLEIYLALQDLSIGTVLEDSIFQPQSLMSARIAGEVVYFMWQEIHRGRIDSVFIIRLSEPVNCQLYFTPDKRLIRADLLQQGIRLYQDFIGQSREAARTAEKPSYGFTHVLLKTPHYGAFLLIALVTMLFFGPAALKWAQAYLYLIGGAVLFLAVPWGLNPILVAIVEGWLSRVLAEGGSIFVYGAVPAVIVGLVHVGLIWAGLKVLGAWRDPKPYRLTALGAFLGGGFALAEACYNAGLQVSLLFDWPLAERAAYIVLQVISGALVGRSLMPTESRGRKLLGVVLIVAVIARYMPLLVQGGVVEVELVYFILVGAMILYLLATTIMIKKIPDGVDD